MTAKPRQRALVANKKVVFEMCSFRMGLGAIILNLWVTLSVAQPSASPAAATTPASALPADAQSPANRSDPKVSAPTTAHPAPDQLEISTIQCGHAPAGFDDYDFKADTVAHFGDAAILSFPRNLIASLSEVQVWVNRRLQLKWLAPELRSFNVKGAQVPIVLKIEQAIGAPPPPGVVPLSKRGEPLLELPAGLKNDIAIIIHASTSTGQLACGMGNFSIVTKAVETYAVVVGLNYLNTKPEYQLQYAQNDAEKVVQHLVDQVGLKPENIWLVTDDPLATTNTDRAVHFSAATSGVGVSSLIDGITNKADPQSKLYFYYSGHMLVAEVARERYASYFFFPDSDPELAATQLERDQFLHKIDQIPMSGTVVILDACYSGGPSLPQAVYASDDDAPPSRAWRPAPPTSLPALPQLGLSDNNQARLTLVSSKGERSWELKEFSHGVFTHYLLEASKASAHLTLEEAFDSAHDQMLLLKPEAWGSKVFSQEPDIRDEHRGGKMDWRLK